MRHRLLPLVLVSLMLTSSMSSVLGASGREVVDNWDDGDAWVEISLISWVANQTEEWDSSGGLPDPQFRICFDVDGEDLDCVNTPTWENQWELNASWNYTIDIPDTSNLLNITIECEDNDAFNDDECDMNADVDDWKLYAEYNWSQNPNMTISGNGDGDGNGTWKNAASVWEVTIFGSDDVDQDGITDDVDECISTMFGAPVNAVGCAWVELDDDDDNVTNGEECNGPCSNWRLVNQFTGSVIFSQDFTVAAYLRDTQLFMSNISSNFTSWDTKTISLDHIVSISNTERFVCGGDGDSHVIADLSKSRHITVERCGEFTSHDVMSSVDLNGNHFIRFNLINYTYINQSKNSLVGENESGYWDDCNDITGFFGSTYFGMAREDESGNLKRSGIRTVCAWTLSGVSIYNFRVPNHEQFIMPVDLYADHTGVTIHTGGIGSYDDEFNRGVSRYFIPYFENTTTLDVTEHLSGSRNTALGHYHAKFCGYWVNGELIYSGQNNFSIAGVTYTTGIYDEAWDHYRSYAQVCDWNVRQTTVEDRILFAVFNDSQTSIFVDVIEPIVDQSIIDEDLDGVLNTHDDCPGTSEGLIVDSLGCHSSQRDSDEDSVSDAEDLCPSTIVGSTVDQNGCSDAQLDLDGDGVPNTRDQCPGTPNDAEVSYYGCGASQGDEDLDGVLNVDDDCPGSWFVDKDNPPETSNGCDGMLESKDDDDDGDGLVNTYDECPDTPSGQSVDAQGCTAAQRNALSDEASSEGDTGDAIVGMFCCFGLLWLVFTAATKTRKKPSSPPRYVQVPQQVIHQQSVHQQQQVMRELENQRRQAEHQVAQLQQQLHQSNQMSAAQLASVQSQLSDMQQQVTATNMAKADMQRELEEMKIQEVERNTLSDSPVNIQDSAVAGDSLIGSTKIENQTVNDADAIARAAAAAAIDAYRMGLDDRDR